MLAFILAPVAVWLWEHPLPSLAATPATIVCGLLLGGAVLVGGVWMFRREEKKEGGK